MDWRSEYLYTKRDDDFSQSAPPYVVMANDFVDNYRAYFYLLLFGLWQFYQAYKYYAHQALLAQEMQVLESSFAIESANDGLLAIVQGMGDEDEADDEDTIKLTPESAEAVRNSMERYIRERQSIYSELLDERVLQE